MDSYSQVLPGTLPLLCKQFSRSKLKVIVCEHSSDLDAIQLQLKFFGYPNILTLPHRDNKVYELTAPSSSNRIRRLYTIHSLLNPKAELEILVTTARALAELYIQPDELFENAFELSIGQHIDMRSVISKLVRLGYRHSNTAIELGEFTKRGSIIDIIAQEDVGYRIDFFGNKIESIRTFLIGTQKSDGRVDKVEVLPAQEYILSESTRETFIHNFTQAYPNQKHPMLDAVKAGMSYSGIQNFLPYLSRNPLKPLVQYLPESSLILADSELLKNYEHEFGQINVRYHMRFNMSEKEGELTPLSPNELILPAETLMRELESYNCQFYSAFQLPGTVQIAKAHHSIYKQAMLKETDYLEEFRQYIGSSKDKIVVGCYSEATVTKLSNIFQKAQLPYVATDNVSTLKTGVANIALYPIENSFIAQNIAFISEVDVMGHTSNKTSRKKAGSSKAALNYLGEINDGELVVHKEHGIGRFAGIETMEIKGALRDFIKLFYANDDKLYIPVENLDLVTKYGEGDALTAELDKLGTLGWQKRKSRLKEKIKLQAQALLATAAERLSKSAQHFAPDSELYRKFCEKFPHVETEDQSRAIKEVLEDLQRETPMDRLLCGDVGFGKTEVALRAAFATVASDQGAQVVVIVPTTLLARQHYKTFTDRFADFPIKISQLSKFTKRTDIATIKKGLKSGEVDVVIGTHALLAPNIEFSNLGLIIIDEEQHFGVKQKEQLKKLKSDAHILTLSATPIPRTLHMSLNNIKSLSLIASPPTVRLSVQTFVLPFDALTIRDAIVREKHRAGRTFIVTPRIKYITELMNQIKSALSDIDIKIISAHGKMTSAQLDQVMNDFYDGKYDVLISTSIIESGLDIPQANTIIVDRSHMFGLAQSYQIRGRVGRSNVKAYAYFTYPPNLVLTENAKKRLGILQSLDELGSSFHIASHDMEIRGYGNLVGEEQSGHVKEVGIELYQDMLSQALIELKAAANDSVDEIVDKDWSPVLNLGVSVQIPEDYIEDSTLRLSLYRKIANLITREELEELYNEMVDRFGKPTDAIEHLLEVVELKQICKQHNIEKIDRGEKGILITFRNNKPKNRQQVIDFINANSISARLRPDMKLSVSLSYVDLSQIKHIVSNIVGG